MYLHVPNRDNRFFITQVFTPKKNTRGILKVIEMALQTSKTKWKTTCNGKNVIFLTSLHNPSSSSPPPFKYLLYHKTIFPISWENYILAKLFNILATTLSDLDHHSRTFSYAPLVQFLCEKLVFLSSAFTYKYNVFYLKKVQWPLVFS